MRQRLSTRPSFLLYTLLWCAALPLVMLYLAWRARRQPAYWQHWAERFLGRARHDLRGAIWIHAVSVGETRACAPLLRALAKRYPDAPLLLTHMTPTGRETGAQIFADLADRLTQRYLPYDLPWAIDGFLQECRPSLGLVMETEVWPMLFVRSAERGLPLALVNGRLSERSLARAQRMRHWISPALGALSCVVVQSSDDALRLRALGREADAVVGNLKFDQAVDPELSARGRQWRTGIGTERPVVLAASTRDGEEALLLDAWQELVLSAGSAGAKGAVEHAAVRPLLIIVPRHPQRFDEVAALIAAHVPDWTRRSALGDEFRAAARAPSILLGDSMGEMQAWYACADVAIIGGSLQPFGAQNMIEACAQGCPVLIGPSDFNFAEAARGAIEAGAASRVRDAETAVLESLRISLNPVERQRMSSAALQFARAHQGATQRTLDALAPVLPELSLRMRNDGYASVTRV